MGQPDRARRNRLGPGGRYNRGDRHKQDCGTQSQHDFPSRQKWQTESARLSTVSGPVLTVRWNGPARGSTLAFSTAEVKLWITPSHNGPGGFQAARSSRAQMSFATGTASSLSHIRPRSTLTRPDDASAVISLWRPAGSECPGRVSR